MKSKCSFILKASTALVLAMLVLFGTVATSVAAVVDNAKNTAEADADTSSEPHGAEGFFAALRKNISNLADTGKKADLAETGWTINGGKVYFDASSITVNDSNKLQICIYGTDTNDWKRDCAHFVSLSKVDGTDSIYYAQVSGTGNKMNDPWGLCFFTAGTTWGDYNVDNCGDPDVQIYTNNITKNATWYSNTYGTDLSSGNTYFINPASGSNGANLTVGTSVPSSFSYNQTAKVSIKAVGASSYTTKTSSNTSTGGTLKITGKVWSSKAVANSSTSASDYSASMNSAVKSSYAKLTTTTYSGYTFDGWYSTNTGTGTQYTTTTGYKVTGATTTYGRYSENANTVTFTKKLGSSAATNITTKSAGVTTKASYTAPEESGYNFTGWTITSGSSNATNVTGTGSASTKTVSLNATGAVTVTANYETAGTCAINAKKTNASGVVLTSESMVAGDKLTVYAEGNSYHTSGNFSVSSSDTSVATVSPSSVAKNGTFTVTAKAAGTATITISCPADSKSTTFTVSVAAPTPKVTFSSYKTDDNSTYVAGGGTLTATYSTGGGGGGDTPTPDPSLPARYLWKNASNSNINNPSTYTVMETFTAATDGNYYTSFSVAAGTNFYFLINDSSSSATSGSKYISNTTSIVKGSGIENWTATEICNYNGTDYRFCKGYCGTTVYVKFSPSEDKIYLQNSAFTYTAAGSGGGEGGGEGGGSSTGTAVTSGGTVPYDANVTFTATRVASVGGDMYQFDGWYATAQPAENETALSTALTYTKNSVTSDVSVYARYKKVLYLTFYNSYMRENENSPWQFVAAPPRTVTVGMGSNVRATYTYKAGTGEQRGEEHTVNATDNYYEGNTLLVLVGETVTLKFSTLASSDAVRGIFFNNARRYTTETETDNLYYLRAPKQGGGAWTSSDLPEGAVADDDWEYDYAANTTIYADENYYDGAAYTAIHSNHLGYVADGAMNQSTHEISWVATQDYLNIDVELDYKYQLHINDDEWEGLKIENMNDEGYYFGGETFANNFKISIDNTDVTDGTYVFTGTTATVTDKDGNAVSGVTVSAKQSGGSAATSTSNLSYFLVSGTMPHSDLYLTIPVVKKYNLKLANIVVSDNGTNKRTMLTETASPSTGNIGTITAIPRTNGVNGSDISSDGTYYTYPSNNNAGHVEAYTSSKNNKYLKGGVNRNGANVEDGSTVTYTFTFASGKDAEYTFVGWFEGTYTNTSNTGFSYDVNYNKKLSGKTTFTYTPTKNTVVIAVATRDIYIGGNFTSAGAYTSTSTNQTWSKNRPLMEFDPTYVNPDDSSKKGRYYYTFDTVTANTEYQFRCYDTVSGTDTTNLSVWKTWNGTDYIQDNDDIFFGRHKYDSDAASHGAFVYKTNTNNWDLIDNTADPHNSVKNHQTNGYAAPVTVYFYAYDGGITVNSTYQWSRAYVSEGRGIDVKSVSGNTTTYNVPTASVANKTVNNKDVVVTTNTTSYGHDNMHEKIYECLVKEMDGSIVVSAQPNDTNLELQAFVVYNIETKKSEAVKDFTTSGTGTSTKYTANILVPNNSKIYVCPVYKFTDTYIQTQGLETHNVFVRADDIDKDDWGGLVAMYSWGTTSGYDSGGWPGQLMIPSDDGSSFYAPLTFQRSGLAGVTFNNYTQVYGGDFVNFLGKYQDAGVSNVAYSNYTKPSADHNYIYQVFDYREPISIIENLNETNPRIYDSEDMTLTFALKPGNKTSDTIENGAYNSNFNFEYLTDSSGKYRVDLNGNKLSTYPTASYYVVCNYTEAYKTGTKTYGFKDGDRDGTKTHNMYSIDWNVYDHNHTKVANGTQLSAAFTDVEKSEMLTYIAKQLIDDGQPVSGKAVMIAYENPKVSSSDNTEAVRYSGQWYADGLNTIIKGNVRVGIYSDGAYLPSDTNAPGYTTATVSFTPDTAVGEQLVTESGCTGNSLAEITKIHAANGDLQFTVSSTDNFLGWYRETKDGGFEPIGSNYKLQTITPSFNEDITYYAFYSASATYRFKYNGRDGSVKYYTAKGSDLTTEELAANGTLNATTRSADIATKLAKITDIKVFNHTLTYELTNADTSSPYTITYTAGDTENTYTLTVWSYDSSGTLVNSGSVTGTWSTALDVTMHEKLGNGTALVGNKPSGKSNAVFIGWKKKGDATNKILSTHANFGYSITQNTAIEPLFGTAAEREVALAEAWQASIDKNVITQELTSEGVGTLYNDTLVDFRYKADTAEQFDLSDKNNECGLLVVAQTGAAAANSTYSTAFNGITATKMQGYVNTLVSGNKDAAKLKAATYGEAYALRIKATSLSRLNRIDLYQILDYATYSGGNYKVIAYTKVGDTYSYSDVITAVYTEGMKYPA